jgi:urease accessory protein
MRGNLPFIFTNLLTGEGLPLVVEWVEQHLVKRSGAPQPV